MNTNIKFLEWVIINNYQLSHVVGQTFHYTNGRTNKTSNQLWDDYLKENPTRKPRVTKGNRKLNRDDIKTIWNMYRKGLNHKQISLEFESTRFHKISRRHVSAILQGKRWTHEIDLLKKLS
jgi:hypothetical protein